MKISTFIQRLSAILAPTALLAFTGCPLATETGAGVGPVPPAAQALAQTTPAAAPKEEPKKEEPKKVDDANPDKNRRPKADRTPRKPGDPIKITFDRPAAR